MEPIPVNWGAPLSCFPIHMDITWTDQVILQLLCKITFVYFVCLNCWLDSISNLISLSDESAGTQEYQIQKSLTSVTLSLPDKLFWNSHLDQVCYFFWRLENNPLIHSNGVLVLVLLNGYIPSKEQQAVRRHLCTVIQVNLHNNRIVWSPSKYLKCHQ